MSSASITNDYKSREKYLRPLPFWERAPTATSLSLLSDVIAFKVVEGDPLLAVFADAESRRLSAVRCRRDKAVEVVHLVAAFALQGLKKLVHVNQLQRFNTSC